MKRNDSILHTGMSSRSFVTQKAKRQQRLDVKREAQQQLQPVYELLMQGFDDETARIMKESLALINAGTTSADTKSIILALQMYDKRLNSLKSKLQTIMRSQIKSVAKQGESFDDK